MLPIKVKTLVDMGIGDGYIGVNGKAPFFEIGHSIKQIEYAQHKAQVLRNVGFEYVTERSYVVKSGKNIGRGYYHVAVYKDDAITTARKYLYGSGKKEIDRSLILNGDVQTLAYWFMDDGTAKKITYLKSGNTRYVYTEPKTAEYRLATDAFSYDQQMYIIEWLYMFDIEAALTKHTKHTWNVAIRKERAKDRFRELIAPYIIPSMQYKIANRHNFTNVPFTVVLA